MAREASSKDGRSPSAPFDHQPATTPPNPPPRGEGFDRFTGPDRIKPGGVQRAKRLRATPTYAEAKLWERLRGLDIRIRRQAPIGLHVVDFACLRAKLVIEVDGGVHDRTDVALRDLERDTWLSGQGFHVLRIPNKRIETDLDAVVAQIEQAIRSTLPGVLPTPLPLEGEGVGGWGGAPLRQDMAREASSKDGRRPSALPHHHPATTPPNPPPRGEGFSDF